MKLALTEIPPPLSQLTGNSRTKGRRSTPAYLVWKTLAGMELNRQKGPHQTITIPVVATYCIRRPSKRKMDIANREKAISDLLTSCRIIEDDSLIEDIRLYWGNPENGKAVEICIEVM